MEDKLVTLAILTYAKAQILKNVLENEGIEAYIHNVNLIQPVISSGVRLRIKESDLPHALQIIESSAWLSEDIIKGKESSSERNKEKRKVLIPIDFSNYLIKHNTDYISKIARVNRLEKGLVLINKDENKFCHDAKN